MSKVYTISDLFYTSWEELTDKKHAAVYQLLLQLKLEEAGTPKYGVLLISILRLLRKNPSLVGKINIEQAVDIFNDQHIPGKGLNFLKQPWYYFPSIPLLVAPEDKMARNTFDHFIYSDNEYSSFIATQDIKYLRRLAATLYQAEFDKENVEPLANALKVEDWHLTLTFFTYAHVREFVVARCKTLMPHTPAAGEGEEQKATPTGGMWLKLKHRLAETPAFQGYETAGKANMYSALDYLEDLAQIKGNGKN